MLEGLNNTIIGQMRFMSSQSVKHMVHESEFKSERFRKDLKAIIDTIKKNIKQAQQLREEKIEAKIDVIKAKGEATRALKDYRKAENKSMKEAKEEIEDQYGIDL